MTTRQTLHCRGPRLWDLHYATATRIRAQLPEGDPSALLRAPDAAAHQRMESELLADLGLVRERLADLQPPTGD